MYDEQHKRYQVLQQYNRHNLGEILDALVPTKQDTRVRGGSFAELINREKRAGFNECVDEVERVIKIFKEQLGDGTEKKLD